MLQQVEFKEDWYEKLINSTNEKDILVSKISELIGNDVESCLEIGLGTSPYFAQKLSDKFDRYTIFVDDFYTFRSFCFY